MKFKNILKLNPEDKIIRGIQENHVKSSDNSNIIGCISSFAFNCPVGEDDGMSVFIESLIIEDGKDPYEFLTEHTNYIGSVYFTVKELESIGLIIEHAPLEDNKYHGIVFGKPPKRKYAESIKRQLHRKCHWYNKIPEDKLESIMGSKR